jgi:hypothetical protein
MGATVDVSFDNGFDPKTVTIALGDTVRWTNDSAAWCSVKSGMYVPPDGGWESGSIDPGTSYERTFNDAGTYPYYFLQTVGSSLRLHTGSVVARGIPATNYIHLECSPEIFRSGDTITIGYVTDFGTYSYAGRPVDVYLAAIETPAVVDAPSSVMDALSGRTVYLFRSGMSGAYAYTGTIEGPTFSGVVFPAAGAAGELRMQAPAISGGWTDFIFAAAFVYRDTGVFVRPDGMPVENSNVIWPVGPRTN